jgi:ribosomal protein L37AE/L43A|tara:strand:- start:131 stop:289 length:159 start_codon:yes stop_codon:yes gene_type:complete
MKRICMLCSAEKQYYKVKRYQHGLMLCHKCEEVIMGLAEDANAIRVLQRRML